MSVVNYRNRVGRQAVKAETPEPLVQLIQRLFESGAHYIELERGFNDIWHVENHRRVRKEGDNGA